MGEGTTQGDSGTDNRTSIKRRRLLQAGTASLGALAVGDTAGAARGFQPCEQLLPDVTILNRDDRPRRVSVGTDRGSAAQARTHSQARIEPGRIHVVERLPAQAQAGRLRAAVASKNGETDTIVAALEDLRPERFRRGLRVIVTAEEAHVETQHLDLPPGEYVEMLRRCEQ